MLLPLYSAAAALGPAVSQPGPETVVLRLDQIPSALSVSATGPDRTDSLLPQETPDQVAEQVRAQIEASRASGSPRPLGLAQGLLDALPEARWTPELYLLRATLRQRLHRFDAALADLDRVLEARPDSRQAWLTRYSIAFARGDLSQADKACQALRRLRDDLLATTCTEEINSFGDHPGQAYETLLHAVAKAGGANAGLRDWALLTLADMATRLDLASAGQHWAIALQRDPADLYRRARYADWLLSQDRPERVLELTEGYNAVDSLAVLRAIAMTRLEHPQREALVANLDTRFEEARWRGELLHKREYARYLLDVAAKPEAALAVARSNWREQRAFPDRVLLIRAARAARDRELLEELARDSHRNS